MSRSARLFSAALLPALLVIVAPRLVAQASASAVGTAPAAKPADVASLDAIVATLYDVISGAKGAPRDWDRFRSLFAPNARLIPTGVDQSGTPRLRSWTAEEYISIAGPSLAADGFYEKEIGRTTTSYGNVWHIMSAYESRRSPDAPPFSRGINSIQLFKGADRWYVVTIFWDSERPGNPIPAEMLRRR